MQATTVQTIQAQSSQRMHNLREVAENNWSSMTRSRSRVNTFYGQAEGEYNPTEKWYLTANISAHQHFVRSEDKNIILQDGDKAIVGYDKGRIELSGSASAKWQPVEPVGLSLVLRQEMFGDKWAPVIPAFFIDGLLSRKGFLSPRNVKKVHAYGIEGKLNIAFETFKGWFFDLNGSYSWTPSINEGEKMSPADQSVGKQLPYVPKHSASLTGRLTWRSWSFLYKWAYYSERYTMSSNDYTITGHLPKYYMSNVSLEKSLSFKPVNLQLKLAVNNLFNEDYLSVLSRPMPGINFEFFVGITPKFRKKKS